MIHLLFRCVRGDRWASARVLVDISTERYMCPDLSKQELMAMLEALGISSEPEFDWHDHFAIHEIGHGLRGLQVDNQSRQSVAWLRVKAAKPDKPMSGSEHDIYDHGIRIPRQGPSALLGAFSRMCELEGFKVERPETPMLFAMTLGIPQYSKERDGEVDWFLDEFPDIVRINGVEILAWEDDTRRRLVKTTLKVEKKEDANGQLLIEGPAEPRAFTV